MMTLYHEAAKQLTKSYCIKSILGTQEAATIFFGQSQVLLISNVFAEIIVNESLEWSARQMALFALHQLLQCDVKNCDDLLDLQGQVSSRRTLLHVEFSFRQRIFFYGPQNYLLRLMKQPGDKVPAEVLVLSVECLTIIARNQGLRTILIDGDVIDAMCASFDVSESLTLCPKFSC